jgi:hypothetical protein
VVTTADGIRSVAKGSEPPEAGAENEGGSSDAMSRGGAFGGLVTHGLKEYANVGLRVSADAGVVGVAEAAAGAARVGAAGGRVVDGGASTSSAIVVGLRRRLKLLRQAAVEVDREWQEQWKTGGQGTAESASGLKSVATSQPTTAALFDTPRFARSFERLLAVLWERRRSEATKPVTGRAKPRSQPTVVVTEAGAY